MADELVIEAGDDIEIELSASETKEAPVVVTQDDGIAELKKQLEEAKQQAEVEKRAREAAEQRARSSDQQAVQFRSAAEQSQYETVIRALDQHRAQSDIIENRLKTAMESGDYAAAAKAQRELSAMEARVIHLENGKLGLEQRRTQPQQQQPVDPLEAQLAQFSAPTRDWLRAHPDVLTNPDQGQLAAAADVKAKRAGHAPDTPGYFSFVEQELGYTPAVDLKPRSAPIPAAPPSRETPNRSVNAAVSGLTPDQARYAAQLGIQVNGSSVKMSAKARASAEICGMSDAEYAKAALADIREGRISDRVS